jgi:hypothetical protein
LALGLSASGAAVRKKTSKKSVASAKKASSKNASSKKAPAKKTTSKKSTSKRTSSAKAVTRTWRNRQLSPAPERYKEIQDALAAKGYMDAADANGEWGQSSVNALKRFQADQRIETTGKINSLSLIALGLGTKREPAAAAAAAAAPPAEAAPPQAK